MQPDGTIPVFEPLDHAGTMRIFRTMLLTPWKRFQGPHLLEHVQLNYTLHSMKATLLSFGPQLGSFVSDSDRLLQGHHQDPKRSLNLYGRDSVWGSLRYQQTVISEIQKGWRPKTAQHRGGQFPLTEPQVTLERFKKVAPAYTFMWLPFSQPADTHAPLLSQDSDPIASDMDSDSSSSSSSSDTSSIAEVTQSESKNEDKPREVIQADEAVFAKHRKVTHAMVTCHDDNGSRPFQLDNYWKAACGAWVLHSGNRISR